MLTEYWKICTHFYITAYTFLERSTEFRETLIQHCSLLYSYFEKKYFVVFIIKVMSYTDLKIYDSNMLTRSAKRINNPTHYTSNFSINLP